MNNASDTDYVSEDIIGSVGPVSLVPLAHDGQVVHPALPQGLNNGAKGGASCKQGSRINNQLEYDGESQNETWTMKKSTRGPRKGRGMSPEIGKYMVSIIRTNLPAQKT
jgi:hypothetical protein